MYHNNPWGSTPSSSESNYPANNPFLESSASNRFPALSDSSEQLSQPSSPYPSLPLSPSSSHFQQQLPYGLQHNQQQYTQWNSQPQSPTFNQGGFPAYGAAQQQYQQQTGYGAYDQQYNQQPTYGGQLQPQSQTSPYAGYTQYQQQPTLSPQQYQKTIISQFDPYGGSEGNTNAWNSGQSRSLGGGGTSIVQPQRTGLNGQAHPRQFIRAHKNELESWDAATWKQALNSFEELKRSWETRRTELQRHLVSGQYLTAEDVASVNGMIKSSESNIDSVTASLIQMQEVLSGYKHSLDAASKRRVKEALNAGLQCLPEWP